MSDRERDLKAIRDTYLGYRRYGRNRLWDKRIVGYARITDDRDRALLALLSRSLPSSGGRVLDVGCGDGGLAKVAREGGLQPVQWLGIDLDPEAVATAGDASPWATFVVGSADRVQQPDATFDVAVASTLFSSLPTDDLEAGVANEVHRLLRPGGWLIWYDLRYSNPRNPAVHGVSPARLRRLFPGWRTELRSMTLLPPVARRLGPLVPVAYGVLELIPTLRSHLVGRLRKPG